VELTGRTARMRRNVGNGWEIVECRLPALVTVLDTANVPRPPAARRIMRYKRARAPIEIQRELARERARAPIEIQRELAREMPDADEAARQAEADRRIAALKAAGLMIEQWDLDAIGADLGWCGLAGSPTKVHRIQSIVLTKEGYTEIPATPEGIRQLVHELIVDRTLG